jgi:23S rRNA (cytosine1962-C5)-methyltransferase
LIVDFYNGVVVLQAHSVGMFKIRQMIADALKELLAEKVKAVYDKSESTLNIAQNTGKEKFLTGTSANAEVSEYGNRFEIDFREGQKTGFFIDQRENRKLLEKYCSGKRVANIFSYTGGFSVYAARGGATLVDSVDSSEKAMYLAHKNMVTNFGENPNHRFFTTDAFDFLKNQQEKYDVIILDPPAFAKHQQALDNALKAYRGINETAIINITPGGILFTFSCSQVVTKEDFRVAVFSASAATGRNVRILHQLSQPADHPINIYHPEGEYLKGLALFVE